MTQPPYPRERPGTHCTGGYVGPMCTENLAPTGIRSADRPSRNESLYRLSYPGPFHWKCTFYLFPRHYIYLLTYLLHAAESFLTSWSVLSWSRNFSHITEPVVSLPLLQVPATCPYPEPVYLLLTFHKVHWPLHSRMIVDVEWARCNWFQLCPTVFLLLYDDILARFKSWTNLDLLAFTSMFQQHNLNILYLKNFSAWAESNHKITLHSGRN